MIFDMVVPLGDCAGATILAYEALCAHLYGRLAKSNISGIIKAPSGSWFSTSSTLVPHVVGTELVCSRG
jgi:hypothetical protein